MALNSQSLMRIDQAGGETSLSQACLQRTFCEALWSQRARPQGGNRIYRETFVWGSVYGTTFSQAHRLRALSLCLLPPLTFPTFCQLPGSVGSVAPFPPGFFSTVATATTLAHDRSSILPTQSICPWIDLRDRFTVIYPWAGDLTARCLSPPIN